MAQCRSQAFEQLRRAIALESPLGDLHHAPVANRGSSPRRRSGSSNIRLALTEADLKMLGRLRYTLFIQRGLKQYQHADHEAKVFLEPVDKASMNFVAIVNARCLCAVRMTRASEAIFDPQLQNTVGRAIASRDYPSTVVLSRMSVLPETGARLHVAAMLRQAYRSGLAAGAKTALLATLPSLAPLYERFGFRSINQFNRDPVAGDLEIFRLDTEDEENLRQARSPLWRDLLAMRSSGHQAGGSDAEER